MILLKSNLLKKYLKKIVIFFFVVLFSSNVFAAATDNDIVSIDLTADEAVVDGITFNADGTKMFFQELIVIKSTNII